MTDQCAGKRAWKRKESANRVLLRIRTYARGDPTTGRVPVRSYRCRRCHQYHLTSQPRRKGN